MVVDLDDVAEATMHIGSDIAWWSRRRRWFVIGVTLFVIGLGVSLYLW